MDQALSNSEAVSMRILPWLQDTEADAVWYSWQATWRDVRIVDSQNRLFAVYNLDSHNLEDEGNRSALKQLFLQAAQLVDSDRDQLPDDWELRYFGNLSSKPADDADKDGLDNYTEFVFGTSPTDPNSRVLLRPKVVANGSQKTLSVSFRRPAGSMVDYRIDASSDLQQWSSGVADVLTSGVPRIAFDGTGTAEATFSLAKPVAGNPLGFLRVKATPKARP